MTSSLAAELSMLVGDLSAWVHVSSVLARGQPISVHTEASLELLLVVVNRDASLSSWDS